LRLLKYFVVQSRLIGLVVDYEGRDSSEVEFLENVVEVVKVLVLLHHRDEHGLPSAHRHDGARLPTVEDASDRIQFVHARVRHVTPTTGTTPRTDPQIPDKSIRRLSEQRNGGSRDHDDQRVSVIARQSGNRGEVQSLSALHKADCDAGVGVGGGCGRNAFSENGLPFREQLLLSCGAEIRLAVEQCARFGALGRIPSDEKIATPGRRARGHRVPLFVEIEWFVVSRYLLMRFASHSTTGTVAALPTA